MLDVGSSELLLIVIVAIVVIGPKDLPRVLYKLGQVIGKGRAMTRHFRSGIDEMIRQAEMEEMEKKWAADNARIMAQTQETPTAPADGADGAPPALPAPDEAFAPQPEEAHHFRADPLPATEEAPAFRAQSAPVEAVPVEPAPEPGHQPKSEGSSAA